MQGPSLLPTSLTEESFAGVTYHLDGELVPVVTIKLEQGHSVFFEHHTMLWKHVNINIGVKPLAGAVKRMFAGMPIIMTEATGNGQIAFSRDGAGHIFPMHLSHGQSLHVREHQFLAATTNIKYGFQRVKGLSNLAFGGNGFFIDEFSATGGDGILWLHGYGNVFHVELGIGEQIDVEPGAWLYKDGGLKMDTVLTKVSTGLFAGQGFVLNRFTGPGRLGMQSMTPPMVAMTEDSRKGSGLGLLAILMQIFKKG